MPETKTNTIAVNIEPTLYALSVLEAESESKSLSGWVRALIIWKLVESGRLDKNKLAMLFTGDSLQVISGIIESLALKKQLSSVTDG